MTYKSSGRFSGRGENSATLPVNPQVDLCRDPTNDCEANGPESIEEAYLVVPCHSAATTDWTRVFLTVTENSQDRGFTFIRDEPVTEPRAIIGWYQEADRPFILCKLWSCTSLEGGSYRVRLFVDEMIQLKPESVETMHRVLDERTAIAAT
jgi:hypothetical protein